MTVGKEDIRLVYQLQVGTMLITGRPVHNIVVISTPFRSTTFLHSYSTLEILYILSNLHMDAYWGPPEFFAVDQGTRYISKEIKMASKADGIPIT